MTWPPRPTGRRRRPIHLIANGTIDVAEVLAVLADRPGVQHVVTGQADPALVDAADLVTDMTKVKRLMDAGRKGQAGIEW